MSKLAIYDSQGAGIGQHEGEFEERIKNFFFGGVRFALDTSGAQNEMICFFRARESSANRSEQYYAVYTVGSVSEVGNFSDKLERRLEQQHGLSLVTTTEDTEVFELIQRSEQPNVTGRTDHLDDVIDAMEGKSSGGLGTTSGSNFDDPYGNKRPDGGLGDTFGGDDGFGGGGGNGGLGGGPPTLDRAKIGVSSYRDAYSVLHYFVGNASDISSYVIAENANSKHLSGYDVAIEKGDYTGVELFPETQRAVDEYKEWRREQLTPDYGDDDSGLTPQVIAGLGIALVGIAILGIYGACMLGLQLPLIDSLPGCDVGDDPDQELQLETVELGDGTDLYVAGSVTGDDAPAVGETVTLTVVVDSGGEANSTADTNETDTDAGEEIESNETAEDEIEGETAEIDVEIGENGTFAQKVETELPPEALEAGTNATVSHGGASDTIELAPSPELTVETARVADETGESLTISGTLTQNDEPLESAEAVERGMSTDITNGTVDVTSYENGLFEATVEQNETIDAGTVTVHYNAVSDEAEVEPHQEIGESEDDSAFFAVVEMDENQRTSDTEIDIATTINNTGTQNATKDVEFRIENETRDTQNVTLDPDEAEALRFEEVDISDLEEGEYSYAVSTEDDERQSTLTVEADDEQADFRLSNIDPEETTLEQGEELSVSARVTNSGGLEATQEISLTIGDDEGVDSVELRLVGGESENIELSGDTSEFEPGEYEYTIESDDDAVTGDLTIEESTDDEETNGESNGDDGSGGDDEETNGESNGDDGSGGDDEENGGS